MKRLLALALLVTSTLVSQAAFAQWTQAEGDGYIKVNGRRLAGNKGFDTSGEVVDVDDFVDMSANIYFEYGVTQDLTFFLSSRTLGYAKYGDESDTYVGAQIFGGRLALLRGKLNAAVDLHVGGHPSRVADLTLDDDALEFDPSVETSRMGWDLRLGTSFGRFWVSASGGLTWFSTTSISTAIMASGQIGASLPAGFVVDLHTSLRQPLGDVTVFNAAGGGETRYLGLGLGVSWWFADWMSVSVAADSALFAEANAAALPLSIGAEFKF